MPRRNRQRKRDHNSMEHEMQRVKKELALLAPPKVENRLVTTVDVFRMTRNTTLINDPTSTYAISGNGIYKFNNVSSTPSYLTIPQEGQIDLAFKMFKYWTPKRIKITVLPYKFFLNTGADVRMFPMYTVNDLDIE